MDIQMQEKDGVATVTIAGEIDSKTAPEAQDSTFWEARFTEKLSAGNHVLTAVTASNGGVVDPLLGTINWNLGALAAGGSVTLTVTADVLDPVGAGIDDFTNTVSEPDDRASRRAVLQNVELFTRPGETHVLEDHGAASK